MSQQKCMSFSKCSNLEAKTLYTSNFVIKERKSRTIISHKQTEISKTTLVKPYMGFTHLKIKIKEKFKLKVNSPR